jgi:hypothetical protein
MGYSLSWLAIRGKSREEIHRDLKITPTGTYSEFPESPCMGAQVGDWYLVIKDHEVFEDLDQVARLSTGCEVVSCFVEEHVMVSEAVGWRDGKKIWFVLHDTQKKIGHMEAKGELPPAYEAIRASLYAEQDSSDVPEADYLFDIPVETARSVTGYRHDIRIDLGPTGYEQLHIVERMTVSRGIIYFLRKTMGLLGRR